MSVETRAAARRSDPRVRDGRIRMAIGVVAPASPFVTAVAFDHPKGEPTCDGPVLRLAGWFLSTRPLKAILVLRDGPDVIASFALGLRADVMAAPNVPPGSFAYGFDDYLTMLALPRAASVTAWVTTAEGVSTPAFHFGGKIEQDVSADDGAHPVYLVSTGRSGSTLAMELISGLPGVVGNARYPREFMHSIWWAQIAAKCGQTPNALTLSTAGLWSLPAPIGPSPFLQQDFLDPGHIAPLANESFEATRAFALASVRRAYGVEPSAKWMIEKSVPEPFVNALSYVYDRSRFIFLARHPADVLASRWSFRVQRADPSFGGEAGLSDAIDVISLADICRRMVQTLDDLPSERTLVLRYEDLQSDRRSELARAAAFLDLDDPDGAADLVTAATPDARHVTARSKSGIGRWKSEIAPDILDPLIAYCSSYYRRFGYAERAD